MSNPSNNLIRISTLLITFVSSVFIYNFVYSSLIFIPSVEVKYEKRVTSSVWITSICEVIDYPNKFKNQKVKIKATVYKNGEGLYLSPYDCSYQTDNFFENYPYLDRTHYIETHYSLSIIENDKPFTSEIDVEVEGVIRIFRESDEHKNINLILGNIKTLSPYRKFIPKAAS